MSDLILLGCLLAGVSYGVGFAHGDLHRRERFMAAIERAEARLNERWRGGQP